MSTARRRLHLSMLAAVTSVVLVGTAGTAYGQEDPSTPPPSDTSTSATETPTEPSAPADPPSGDPSEPAAQDPDVREEPASAEPDPEDPQRPPGPFVSAVATCHNGSAEVTVHVLYQPADALIQVHLNQIVNGGGFNDSKTAEYDKDNGWHIAGFDSPPVGLYNVHVDGGDGVRADVAVEVRDCDDLDPADGALSIDVECKAGWGIVTFQVANQETGDVRAYTLTIADVPAYDIELSPGLFLRVTENNFDDGEYTARLTGEGLDITKEFTVACVSGNPPRIVQVAGFCDVQDPSKPASAFVVLANENRAEITYTVVVRQAGKPELSSSVTVASGQSGSAEFDNVGPGDHPVQITGSDDTKAATTLRIDHCDEVEGDQDKLQVTSRCDGATSVVTFRFFPFGPYPSTHEFSVDGTDTYNRTFFVGGEGPYEFDRYVGEFADGTYTARLVGDGLNTVEQFTVDCDGVPNTPPTTAPTPQGRSASGLASTGAAVGGLLMLGLLALGMGGVLVLTGRRRRAAQSDT